MEPDLDLRDPTDQPITRGLPRSTTLLPWIVAVIIGALAAGGYFLYRNRAVGEPASPAATAATPTSPAAPLGGTAEAVVVPPLDQSDAVVRELLSKLSSDPRFLAWLATDGLVRTFTVVVANVAAGETPSRHLKLMRPLSGFRVSGRGAALSTDPASYERYNGLADAAASIDPAGSARLYATLKPRIEEAYRDLGYPDTSFDQTLERAIVRLLETPVPDGPLRLVPSGAAEYTYANPSLDGLSAAQKQLLRTGPRNARVIQDALRATALALGIPTDRLPPSRQ